MNSPRPGSDQQASGARVSPAGVNPDLHVLADLLPLAAPLRLNLCPSGSCNFKCRHCLMGRPELLRNTTVRPGNMSWQLYEKIVADLRELPAALKRLNLSGLFGEPLINRKLEQMVSLAKSAGVAEIVETYTNGSLMTPERSKSIVTSGLDILTVSVDHVSDDGYRAITQGAWHDYGAIVRNVAALREERDRAGVSLRIYAKIIATEFSESELAKFASDFEPVADRVFSMELHNWTGDGGVNTRGQRPEIGYDGVTPVKPDRRVCPFPFYMLQIDAHGRVGVCTSDWKMGAEVGNVAEESLVDIWNGRRLRDLRAMMLTKGRQAHPTCGQCHKVTCVVPPPNDLDEHIERLLPFYVTR
jgi:MoaA/NifB/PqqE/SkfB family radical SAM enzyme